MVIISIYIGNNHFLLGKESNSKEIIKKINFYRKLADKKIEKIFKYISFFNTNSNKILSLIGEYKLIFGLELKYISRAKANGINLKKEFYKIERSARKNIEALNILLNITPEEVRSSLREALNLTQKGRITLITYFAKMNNSGEENFPLNLINFKEILQKGGN
jgi:hypothetical protein